MYCALQVCIKLEVIALIMILNKFIFAIFNKLNIKF